MKSLFVYYFVPALTTFLLYFIGVPEGVITAMTWICFIFSSGLIALFYLAFLGLKLESVPISKALWPIMAVDLTMWDLAKNVCLTTGMTLICLIIPIPVLSFLPILFALASTSAVLGFLDHTSREYSDLITKIQDKHGKDTYREDDY